MAHVQVKEDHDMLHGPQPCSPHDVHEYELSVARCKLPLPTEDHAEVKIGGPCPCKSDAPRCLYGQGTYFTSQRMAAAYAKQELSHQYTCAKHARTFHAQGSGPKLRHPRRFPEQPHRRHPLRLSRPMSGGVRPGPPI